MSDNPLVNLAGIGRDIGRALRGGDDDVPDEAGPEIDPPGGAAGLPPLRYPTNPDGTPFQVPRGYGNWPKPEFAPPPDGRCHTVIWAGWSTKSQVWRPQGYVYGPNGEQLGRIDYEGSRNDAEHEYPHYKQFGGLTGGWRQFPNERLPDWVPMPDPFYQPPVLTSE